MATTKSNGSDVDFRIGSLIGEAGVGGNGELLLGAMADFYPPELQAAQEKRVNLELTERLERAEDGTFPEVSKIAGIDVENAVVRGGQRGKGTAWVSYAGYDAQGSTIKGAFPYEDLGSRNSDDHVSQHDRLQDSDAAKAHREAAEKAASASDDEALRKQVADLQRRLDEAEQSSGQTTGPAEPIQGYADLNAKDIVSRIEESDDRHTVTAIRDYEAADQDRSTVTKAADKRLEELDQQDAEQKAALEENATLKARIAELEAQASTT